ncbi:hypothetical protein THAOC_24648 [Thalassiosira oceanica]|uniref:Uncharacterized protein n=1 Tax=Thalassiosira oceanica TaxID=159749 RepID=K0RPB0_THAOC|nr:hypothetical protein THAOC_24648 [Thalassiosira oceanica]|eukprot:EJK55608.1 hypothetical protein THAOC_24648 [Thalassiosira oceanica]
MNQASHLEQCSLRVTATERGPNMLGYEQMTCDLGRGQTRCGGSQLGLDGTVALDRRWREAVLPPSGMAAVVVGLAQDSQRLAKATSLPQQFPWPGDAATERGVDVWVKREAVSQSLRFRTNTCDMNQASHLKQRSLRVTADRAGQNLVQTLMVRPSGAQACWDYVVRCDRARG